MVGGRYGFKLLNRLLALKGIYWFEAEESEEKAIQALCLNLLTYRCCPGVEDLFMGLSP